MSEPSTPAPATPPRIESRLRKAGILLLLGLVVEGATLFALDRPVGFLTFAGAAGLLVLAGIALYLWAIVSQSGGAQP